MLPSASANADKVPANLKSADYVAQGISALGIVWNTKSGTPEPKEWRDLTEAAFKDKVTTPDPALSGASLDLLIGLQNGLGDKAWTLFEALKKNGMVVSGPNAQAVTPVMQGAKAAVFGAVDYVSYGNIQQGESLKVIFPASGTVIAPRPMMILKTTAHADDAKAFADGRNVQLVDGTKLFAMIKQAKQAMTSAAPSKMSEPHMNQSSASVAPSCPQCGSEMVKRTARKGGNAGGEFWGCSKFPACRGVRQLS